MAASRAARGSQATDSTADPGPQQVVAPGIAAPGLGLAQGSEGLNLLEYLPGDDGRHIDGNPLVPGSVHGVMALALGRRATPTPAYGLYLIIPIANNADYSVTIL
jgi:hypothetical protein